MASAATVESTTTAAAMEATAASATMEPAAYGSAVIATTREAAPHCGAVITTGVASVVSAAVAITASVAVSTAIAVVSATVAVDAAVSITIPTSVPRAGANEDTAAKPRRAVVSIRRAGIGVVTVIAIGTNWSSIAIAPIHGASYADPDRNLGMRVSRCRDDQHSE
jgi:hypothetical protein